MLAAITDTQSEELIVYAREWILDLKAADADDYEGYVERILGETDAQTRRRISRRYRGGWAAFVRESIGQCSPAVDSNLNTGAQRQPKNEKTDR